MNFDTEPGRAVNRPQQPRRGRRWWIAALAICLSASVAAGWWFAVRPSNEELLAEAQTAFARGEYRESSRLATRLIERVPDSRIALLVAARSAARLDEHSRAIGYYDRIGDDGSESAIAAMMEAGELLLFKMNRATDSERQFLKVVAHRPDDATALNRLVYLYSMEGRTKECVEFLFRQIRLGEFTADHLLMLGQRTTFVEDPSTIDAFLRSNPDDIVPTIGRARIALSQNHNLEAEKLLQQVLTQDAQQIEAQALMGLALLENGDGQKFLRWHRAIPSAAEAHPMVWLVRGHWARRQNDNKTAVRCYWESLRREPQQKPASYQLGQTLIAIGQTKTAEEFLEHATMLDELNALLDRLYTNRQDLEAMRQVALRMESMGRMWEAWGWSRLAFSVNPRARWASEGVARIAPQLRNDTPPTLKSSHPGLQLDWSEYPLPTWGLSAAAAKIDLTSQDVHQRPVTFVESAAAAQIDFAYFNGSAGRRGAKRIYEQMGGGVAVLDFDADGWPDLYFTQGCSWPPNSGQRQNLDRLYRNLGDGTFDDVTADCHVVEWGYGQGTTIGDFNSDGFPDLFVANIGSNRLYVNNGDGTFSDVTATAAIAGDDWTTSCVLADLNGDAIPDLYAVNYLYGEQIFSKICRDAEGRPGLCAPSEFSPAQDRLYTAVGDGTFVEKTVPIGNGLEEGNGLGVVAADFDRSGLLSLFVANDQTANFFRHNQTSPRGGDVSFVESALTNGLGFDRDGLAMACMGVAAGDANDDGMLDLFVTNYARESNSLYVQQQGLRFSDMTQQAGLRDGSFAMLGFGTQFLDADLDGLPDLVVANGHVDDSGNDGAAYPMPPQYFRNIGGGRFVESPQSQLGPYFQAAHVGRSLARLDWNRDGREEFAVSHLESPVALLTNTTANAGNFVAIRLVGVESSRDAIGTSVTVTMGNRQHTQQLTAGDGYQASNQRQLVFGLAENENIDRIELHWPSGLKQVLESLSAGAEYLIVEGHPRPLRIPK
ncbi:MAG: tetratricopeptide repeat protein [Planctomycetaceae bacterium]|jgi:tetratricopeptide (TPR) repeat protein|nr:tetratricopeptide repeat protein [Planctomycetaceae bacterium]MBT6153307.1 tetratricopeptide repeat protein [Planctomycetaceae bacterium]MBT6483226.1 tetratricopeptide repeat protein [Planctomycetaceae bacterium]MBT6496337.1 tetratricopeptide repeat protein [Planctomycetaceae bacterium]